MRRVAAAWLGGVLCVGCAGPPPDVLAPPPSASASASPSSAEGLYEPPTSARFADPKLRERVRARPLTYFRATNDAFTREACRRLESVVASMPPVTLHGDAHLEQYAVADDGRGLVDFDDTTIGPPAIDIVRFLASVWLAADMREGDAEPAARAFFDAYLTALVDPTFSVPEPTVTRRIREGFEPDVRSWLDRVEATITPMPAEKRAHMSDAKRHYVTQMCAQNPGLSPSFFEAKNIGTIELGVGSARETKYLARIEGPTSAPEDDVVIEMKQVTAAPHGSCVLDGPNDPMRVIVGQTRLANTPQRLVGALDADGKRFLVQAWRPHYTEVDIELMRGPAELVEVARDVGAQLGRGHPRGLADPFEAELRQSLVASVRAARPALEDASRALARDTLDAWQRFRRESEGGAATR